MPEEVKRVYEGLPDPQAHAADADLVIDPITASTLGDANLDYEGPMNDEERMYYATWAGMTMKDTLKVVSDNWAVERIAQKSFDMADAMLAEYRKRVKTQ